MMSLKTDRTRYIQNWVEYYLQHQPSTLFENSVLGTLSADNRYLYAIDDLAIAPPPQIGGADARFNQSIVHPSPQIADAIAGSRLQAFDLVSGKLRWELGNKNSELADSYFLAPPLPIDGQLYILVQKQQELRLCTLEQKSGKIIANPTLAVCRHAACGEIKTAACALRTSPAPMAFWSAPPMRVPSSESMCRQARRPGPTSTEMGARLRPRKNASGRAGRRSSRMARSLSLMSIHPRSSAWTCTAAFVYGASRWPRRIVTLAAWPMARC